VTASTIGAEYSGDLRAELNRATRTKRTDDTDPGREEGRGAFHGGIEVATTFDLGEWTGLPGARPMEPNPATEAHTCGAATCGSELEARHVFTPELRGAEEVHP